MGQSLSAIYLHVVFSTKNRHPFFGEATLRRDLHRYMGGISGHLNCVPIQVGGVADHVHILGELSRTVTVAEWVKEVKRASNVWLKEERGVDPAFAWQTGYGAISAGRRELEQVRAYVQGQEENTGPSRFRMSCGRSCGNTICRAMSSTFGIESGRESARGAATPSALVGWLVGVPGVGAGAPTPG